MAGWRPIFRALLTTSFLKRLAACITAIPLPIKLYVALRVGVAVILSQRPTPGTIIIEYSKNRFCGETYVLASVLISQVFKLVFGAKSFVPGEKLAKLRKEEDQ